MLSPAHGLLRGLRAASLGVVAFVLASVAHVVAGGAAPGPAVFLLLAGLIGMASVLLTRVRLSPLRVVVSLAGMQVLLHQAFMRLSAPAGCVLTGMSAPAGGHVAMGHGGQLAPECASGMVHAGMGQGSMSSAMIMLGAHIAATALMAALLAYGEKLMWFLAGWVRPARWLPAGAPVLPAVRAFSYGAPSMLRVRFACGGVGRRGPPPQGLFAIV
jgi:hypothetical protein